MKKKDEVTVGEELKKAFAILLPKEEDTANEDIKRHGQEQDEE